MRIPVVRAALLVAVDLNAQMIPNAARLLYQADKTHTITRGRRQDNDFVCVVYRYLWIDRAVYPDWVDHLIKHGNVDGTENGHGVLCFKLESIQCADPKTRLYLLQFIVDCCRQWGRPIIIDATNAAKEIAAGPKDGHAFGTLWVQFGSKIELPYPHFENSPSNSFARGAYLWQPSKRPPSYRKMPTDFDPDITTETNLPKGPPPLVRPRFENQADASPGRLAVQRQGQNFSSYAITTSFHAHRIALMDA